MQEPPKKSAFKKNAVNDQDNRPEGNPDPLKALDLSGFEPGSIEPENKFEPIPPPDPRFVDDDPDISPSDYHLGICIGMTLGGYLAHQWTIKKHIAADHYYYWVAGGVIAGVFAGIFIGWLLAKFFSRVVRYCSGAIEVAAKVGGTIGFFIGAACAIVVIGPTHHFEMIIFLGVVGSLIGGLAAIAIALIFSSVITIFIPFEKKDDDGENDNE